MKDYNRQPDELTLDELMESLAFYDAGHYLCRWYVDTRDLPGMISAACEEMDNLARRAEVISWCMELHREGIGEDFFKGVALIAEEIHHRIRIVQAIIRKALKEMEEEKP